MGIKNTIPSDDPLHKFDGPLLSTLLSEGRLPLRYQRMIARRFNRIAGYCIKNWLFKKIRKTKIIPVNPNAAVEIHTLLCHRDLDMYLIAIKSFLRFYNDVAVVVHDDGSLSNPDREIIRYHLPGVLIIGRPEADMAVGKVLADKPECLNYRDIRINSFQLFDYSILSREKKLISLDSDVIFIRQPTEVIAWITSENNYFIYNQEEGGTQIGRQMRRLNIPCIGNVNAGFIGFYRDAIDFDLVEKYLPVLKGNPKWLYAQGYLDICLRQSAYEPKPLETDEYLIYTGHGAKALEKAKMVHFILYLRFVQSFYPRFVRALIKDLGRNRQKIN